jgi:acyl-CoA synthetase (AMP-forming)/AMP-acid ligase II
LTGQPEEVVTYGRLRQQVRTVANPSIHRGASSSLSSGTTGQPKDVVLTHRNVAATLCQHEMLYRVGQGNVHDASFLARRLRRPG